MIRGLELEDIGDRLAIITAPGSGGLDPVFDELVGVLVEHDVDVLITDPQFGGDFDLLAELARETRVSIMALSGAAAAAVPAKAASIRQARTFRKALAQVTDIRPAKRRLWRSELVTLAVAAWNRNLPCYNSILGFLPGIPGIMAI